MSATPLRDVLASIAGGAASFAQIAESTGLPMDVCRAAVDHLIRSGRLQAKELAIGCPASGCGGCASGRADGTAGCGVAGPSALGPSALGRGPVLVAVSLPAGRSPQVGRLSTV